MRVYVIGQSKLKRGVFAIFSDIIAKKLNMSYTVQPCSKYGSIPEGSTGTLLAYGTWAGCMGDLIRNVSDISVAVSADVKRFGHVHFTSPFEYSFVTFTMSKRKLYYTWTTIFAAFVPNVWAMVVLSVILATIIFHQIDVLILKQAGS